MRILHAPVDINSAAWETSQVERSMGHYSQVMVFDEYFGCSYDYNLHFLNNNKIINFLNASSFFIKSLKKYDIFHFYYGKTLIPFPWYPGRRIIPILLDLVILKLLRKKIFFTFHGSDVRRKILFLKNYKNNMYKKVNFSDYLEDIFKLVRLKFISIFADKVFVTTPDLKFFIPFAEITPQRINLKNWEISSRKKLLKLKSLKSKVVIFHAPGDRQSKGTEYIIKIVKRIQKEGAFISFELAENIDHSQIKRFFDNADICIDQLLSGWYGMFSVEAMALNKPVICYLNKDLFSFVPWAKDIPIVNANIANLYDKLKWLIENPQEREKIGKMGREFVEKWHNPIKTAEKLTKLYEK